MVKLDKELEQYRNIMIPPDHFEDGFSWAALLGAMFIGFLMVPGSMYMGLLAGVGVGPAAQWVVVILFIEIAKRAHRHLRRAEIYVLFYMAGAALASPFSGLLWNQFFVQSQALIGQGLAQDVPIWYAPKDPEVLANQNFFQLAWLPAVGLVLFHTVVSRVNNTILGYGLFKIASDREKLPFPMAPIGAQGMMALSEDLEEGEGKAPTWRWRAFAIGGALGLVFGFLYMGLPTLSSAVLGTKIQMLPIPFADWCGRTEGFLPATATGLSFDMGQFVIGMVIPFWAVIGTFCGLIITFILNPVLYYNGLLPSWSPGDSTVETLFKDTVDFYFSFGIGVSLAIAIMGFIAVYMGIKRARQERADGVLVDSGPPKGRGDIPFSVIGIVYLLSTLAYILLSGFLIHWHTGVMVVLIFYGVLYTPFISYVTARLEGTVGQALVIPFIREAGMILSGYKGIACWFLPLPMANYGMRTVGYRQAELTGTKMTSLWKTEAVLVPFIIVCSIFFAQFIWSMGPIPSSNYPYAEMMWELQAKNQALLYSSTAGGYSQFLEAFKPSLIFIGLGSGLAMFSILKALSAPTMLMYGCVTGLNQTMPHTAIPQILGALLARFYLEKRMGLKWRQYAPVVSAGFMCGTGLITIFTVGVMFLSKSVFKLPY